MSDALPEINWNEIDLPNHLTMPWVLKNILMKYKCISRGYSPSWCYKEFFEAYPEFLEPVKERLKTVTTGYPSIFAAHLYHYGLMSEEEIIEIITNDSVTPEHTKNLVLLELCDLHGGVWYNMCAGKIRPESPINVLELRSL